MPTFISINNAIVNFDPSYSQYGTYNVVIELSDNNPYNPKKSQYLIYINVINAKYKQLMPIVPSGNNKSSNNTNKTEHIYSPNNPNLEISYISID